MVFKSVPRSKRCVAQLCRSVCGDTFFLMPARRAAARTAYHTVFESIGCSTLVRLEFESAVLLDQYRLGNKKVLGFLHFPRRARPRAALATGSHRGPSRLC